jgi:hypothetical protein
MAGVAGLQRETDRRQQARRRPSAGRADAPAQDLLSRHPERAQQAKGKQGDDAEENPKLLKFVHDI